MSKKIIFSDGVKPISAAHVQTPKRGIFGASGATEVFGALAKPNWSLRLGFGLGFVLGLGLQPLARAEKTCWFGGSTAGLIYNCFKRIS